MVFDPVRGTLSYDADAIDLAPGESIVDSFSCAVGDEYGGTSIATVRFTVTGAAEAADFATAPQLCGSRR